MVWHIIRANILLIVNAILTDGIRRMFLNALTKKVEANCQKQVFFTCSGIINLLFDGLAYKILRKTQNIVLYAKPRIRSVYLLQKASAGIRPVVNRLNQDTTVYYDLVFCFFSCPYMVK